MKRLNYTGLKRLASQFVSKSSNTPGLVYRSPVTLSNTNTQGALMQAICTGVGSVFDSVYNTEIVFELYEVSTGCVVDSVAIPFKEIRSTGERVYLKGGFFMNQWTGSMEDSAVDLVVRPGGDVWIETAMATQEILVRFYFREFTVIIY